MESLQVALTPMVQPLQNLRWHHQNQSGQLCGSYSNQCLCPISYRVEVEIVLVDENNKVLTGDEAVDVLSDSAVQERLENEGIITDGFEPGIYQKH